MARDLNQEESAMKIVSYTVSCAILISLTFLPVTIFAYKKYHGLEDVASSRFSGEAVEDDEVTDCAIHIKLGLFEKKIRLAG